MADSFSWNNGVLYLWTGTNPASEIALVRDVNVSMVRAYINQQSVNGDYYNVMTGERADVSFSVVYTPDMALFRVFNQSTAVHMKLHHAYGNNSAGVILYSGVFDRWGIGGSEGQVFNAPVAYHSNVWTGYGQ
jgi:hypothetical protein